MAKWGSCDFRELKKFQQKLEQMSKLEINKFCQDVSRELAARLLRKVIFLTKPGDYSHEITVIAKRDGKKHKKGEKYTKSVNPSGKLGGTLRRGWTARTEEEAKNGKGKGNKNQEEITAWVNELPIKRKGNIFQIDVTNVVSYASYVEYGHRTRNHKGWVEGKYMLTISEKELNTELPKFIEKKLIELLSEVFQ